MLFQQFGINYNTIDPFYRKGSVLVRVDPNALPKAEGEASPPTPEPATNGDAESGNDAAGQGEESEETDKAEQRRQRKLEKKQQKATKYEGMTGPVVYLNDDIIRDAFWDERPWLLV